MCVHAAGKRSHSYAQHACAKQAVKQKKEIKLVQVFAGRKRWRWARAEGALSYSLTRFNTALSFSFLPAPRDKNTHSFEWLGCQRVVFHLSTLQHFKCVERERESEGGREREGGQWEELCLQWERFRFQLDGKIVNRLPSVSATTDTLCVPIPPPVRTKSTAPQALQPAWSMKHQVNHWHIRSYWPQRHIQVRNHPNTKELVENSKTGLGGSFMGIWFIDSAIQILVLLTSYNPARNTATQLMKSIKCILGETERHEARPWPQLNRNFWILSARL